MECALGPREVGRLYNEGSVVLTTIQKLQQDADTDRLKAMRLLRQDYIMTMEVRISLQNGLTDTKTNLSPRQKEMPRQTRWETT